MKDIITNLIKEYYKTDIIGKEVLIIEKQGKQMINIFDELMPNKWGLRTTTNQPDVEGAKKILEDRRKLKATQVFMHTTRILEGKKVQGEWDELYHRTPPNINSPHEDLMDYSLGALYHLDIITPYEYSELSAIADEQGIILGMQLHPKQVDDPTDGALE